MMSKTNIVSLSDVGARVTDVARISGRGAPKRAGYALKAIFDVVFAVLAITFFAPFMVIAAILIFAQDRGPVFIVQKRIGHKGKVFGCLKFRTMVVDAQERLEQLLAECPTARAEWAARQKLRDDPRITRIGQFLRTTSLDELPQFFNILLGDMSVVGPRPIVKDEIVKYGGAFSAYSSVKPGVTGMWQVSGRSDTSYEERVELDVEYVNDVNFKTDISIILKTVSVVLGGRGAY